MDVQSVIDKIKELVKKGNVSRIIVCRKGEQLLNIPVSVGAVGAVVGLAAAKWVTLAAVLATIGLGCTVEVIKSDGGIVNVMDEESSQKMRRRDGSPSWPSASETARIISSSGMASMMWVCASAA